MDLYRGHVTGEGVDLEPKNPPLCQEGSRDLIVDRRAAMSWNRDGLGGVLLPYHALMTRTNDEELAAQLDGLLVWLLPASLADAADVEGLGALTARFRGTIGTLDVRHGGPLLLEAATREAIEDAVHWVYARGGDQRSLADQRLGSLAAGFHRSGSRDDFCRRVVVSSCRPAPGLASGRWGAFATVGLPALSGDHESDVRSLRWSI